MGRTNRLYERFQLAIAAASLVAGIVIFAGQKRQKKVIPTTAALVQEYHTRVLPIQGYDLMRNGLYTMGSGSLVQLPNQVTGLITNHHVCEGVLMNFPRVLSTYKGETVTDLYIVKDNPKVDLCLLISLNLIREKNFNVRAINNFRVGEGILLLGYPLAGPLVPQTGYYVQQADMWISGPIPPTGCAGEIIGSIFGLYCAQRQRLNAMTTLTFPGNSGSPVFNEEGDMVGVVNSANSGTNQGNFISGYVVDEFLRAN